jgi:hypothetical protein
VYYPKKPVSLVIRESPSSGASAAFVTKVCRRFHHPAGVWEQMHGRAAKDLTTRAIETGGGPGRAARQHGIGRAFAKQEAEEVDRIPR